MTAGSSFAAPAFAETLFERMLPRPISQPGFWPALATVLIGSALLTVSAKLSVPFYPVPLSLQTLVVLCLGLVLGPRLAGLTVLAYLVEGALGLPVFAGTPAQGIGIAYMMGPTGGYLLGFLVAAVYTGHLARRRWDRSIVWTVAAMLIGNLIIYTFGLLWLGSVIGWNKPLLALGLFPFLLGDALKIGVAALALPAIWKLLGRSR